MGCDRKTELKSKTWALVPVHLQSRSFPSLQLLFYILLCTKQVPLYQCSQGHWIHYLISPRFIFIMIKYHLSHLFQKTGQPNKIHMEMSHNCKANTRHHVHQLEEISTQEGGTLLSRSPRQGWGAALIAPFWAVEPTPFGQKRTDTTGNPKSQVLFQKQKTDGYKKDNQAQFKRLERMERKILMPKL